MVTKKNVFYVVTLDLTRISTRLAPQNEHQHLSFVENIHAVGKKWPEMIVKLPNAKVCDILLSGTDVILLIRSNHQFRIYKSGDNRTTTTKPVAAEKKGFMSCATKKIKSVKKFREYQNS